VAVWPAPDGTTRPEIRPHGSATESPGPSVRSIVIGRYRGTVVVTVHGDLGPTRAAHLGLILTDLIDGQGNLSLIVDLHDATATDAASVSVFADAAERAGRHGGVITLSEPPDILQEALRQRGLPISPHLAPVSSLK